MNFRVELKEEPLKKPNIVARGVKCKDKMIEGLSSHKVYSYLKKYPEQALTNLNISLN